MYDYIIIGAGVSGLSFARLLQQRGNNNFIILEKEDHAGGLCRTRDIQGNAVDTGGGHFFHSRYQEVFDFVFDHIPKSAFNVFLRNTAIKFPNGMVVNFPLEANLWQMPVEMQIDYLMSIINCHSMKPGAARHEANYQEWIINNLGSKIANDFFIPYNTKVWGIDLSLVSTEWLYKVPQVDLKAILKTIIRKQSVDDFPYHTFYYPKVGGYQAITDAIRDRVLKEASPVCIRYRQPVTEMIFMKYSQLTSHWLVNGYQGRRVINTVPWIELNHCLKEPDVRKLAWSGMVTSVLKGDYDHSFQWMYYPDMDLNHHRDFFLDNFNAANPDKLIARETHTDRWYPGADALHEEENQYAYPLPVNAAKPVIKGLLGLFETMNLYGLGRWGQWEYWNIDMCIKSAMELVERLES